VRKFYKVKRVLVAVIMLLLSVLIYLLWINDSGCAKLAHADPPPEAARTPITVDAEVVERVERAMLWITTVKSPNPRNSVRRKPQWRKELATYIVQESQRRDLPWSLVTVMVFKESSFNHKAVGDLGELGLMQILNDDVKRQCKKFGWDLKTPDGQIKCGTWHLEWCWKVKCKGDIRHGVTFYATGRTCRPDTVHLKDVVRSRFRLAERLLAVTKEGPDA
jgi:hypothetical protein